MHAFTAPSRPRSVPPARLRALLAEPGGRRRLLRALDEQASPRPAALDDQQLLMRAHDLLERGRLGSLDV